jgi:hypothetical protein
MATKDTTQMDAADAALKKADATELFQLFKSAISDKEQLTGALETVVAHYVGMSESPRFATNSPDVISSMERVALAAIELAREVAGKPDAE